MKHELQPWHAELICSFQDLHYRLNLGIDLCTQVHICVFLKAVKRYEKVVGSKLQEQVV